MKYLTPFMVSRQPQEVEGNHVSWEQQAGEEGEKRSGCELENHFKKEISKPQGQVIQCHCHSQVIYKVHEGLLPAAAPAF